MEKHKLIEYALGLYIAFCTAMGVILGAIFNNLIYFMLGGGAIGVIVGVILHSTLRRERKRKDADRIIKD
ncbi:MAG: hypothetical protein GX802_02190 [Clostridiales bacterium]|nr:hypothetical protein [Clostridiales bacterium]